MKKKLIALVLTLITVFSVVSVAFITTQAADYYIRTGAYYTIKNMGSKKMLNVYGSKNKSNTNVTVYAKDNTSGQAFKLQKNGSGYIFVPKCATSCALNVYGTSAKNNANVNIWTKSGNDTQRWIIKYNSKLGGFVICSANNTNYVLTATGSANSSNVCLEKYDSTNKYQVWTSGAFAICEEQKQENKNITPVVYSQLSDKSSFNYPGGSGSTYETSGCGVYSLVNAVKYLTGKKIDPHALGKFAIQCGARVKGGVNGKLLCEKASRSDDFGKQYGFYLSETYTFGSSKRTMKCSIGGMKSGSYYPSKSEWDTLYNKLVSHLEKGDVAVVLVMGHYMAIVDYNNETDEFLMLDSAAYKSKRLTENKGKYQWVTSDQLNYNEAPKANSKYNNQGPYIHLRKEVMFLSKR